MAVNTFYDISTEKNIRYAEAPKMTYYARIRSNLTGQILTNWQYYDTSIWYYGICNSLEGGESEYIIEFDIWNNEPGFNAGTYDVHNKVARACQLSIEPIDASEEQMQLFKTIPFLYGRCYVNNTREEWQPITMNNPLTLIYGNVKSEEQGIIFNTDHTILQTKIILPANEILNEHQKYMFQLKFSYSYE